MQSEIPLSRNYVKVSAGCRAASMERGASKVHKRAVYLGSERPPCHSWQEVFAPKGFMAATRWRSDSGNGIDPSTAACQNASKDRR